MEKVTIFIGIFKKEIITPIIDDNYIFLALTN